MPTTAEQATIAQSCILIRIPRLYRVGMAGRDLYDATRGIWKLGRRRERAAYAMAVVDGMVHEVYSIEAWHPAGSTPYASRQFTREQLEGRWEFTGVLAPETVRESYVGRSVAHYFTRGARNPIQYVNS